MLEKQQQFKNLVNNIYNRTIMLTHLIIIFSNNIGDEFVVRTISGIQWDQVKAAVV